MPLKTKCISQLENWRRSRQTMQDLVPPKSRKVYDSYVMLIMKSSDYKDQISEFPRGKTINYYWRLCLTGACGAMISPIWQLEIS
jgi:hypothetical protein